MEENKQEETIYFPDKTKLTTLINKLKIIINGINLQDRKFNLENLKGAEETGRQLERILFLARQINSANSIRVKNSSNSIDEFIKIPKLSLFE